MKTLKATRTMHGWTFESSTISTSQYRTKSDKEAMTWIRNYRRKGFKIVHKKGLGGMYQEVNGVKE